MCNYLLFIRKAFSLWIRIGGQVVRNTLDKFLKYFLLLFISLIPAISIAQKVMLQDTLQTVKTRGYLVCGVSQGLAGFSTPDDRGHWQGIDADFCRAVAVAVLGDKRKVKFIPLSTKDRFTALQSGEIDLLARNTTWTLSRDSALGLDFAGVLYYDGQGFIVKNEIKNSTLKVSSIADLNGAIICTNAGTTTELNIADYFQSHNLKYQIITFEKSDEAVLAYDTGRCDAYSTDRAGLFAQRLQLKDQSNHTILSETISKEPLGPVIRQGDDNWSNIVRWTLFALINAEELGVNQHNVTSMGDTTQPDIQRLLGYQGGLGEKLGLQNDWVYQIILQVGNYEDIFERNLGTLSLLKVDRGVNRLWTEGGILYAPPFR